MPNICSQCFIPSVLSTPLQNSRYQTYQRMWNYMKSKQPGVFVKSTEEGIARVVNSKYAFLMESTMNEYHRGLNCNLTQIGGLLDTKGYGIGMPLGNSDHIFWKSTCVILVTKTCKSGPFLQKAASLAILKKILQIRVFLLFFGPDAPFTCKI